MTPRTRTFYLEKVQRYGIKIQDVLVEEAKNVTYPCIYLEKFAIQFELRKAIPYVCRNFQHFVKTLDIRARNLAATISHHDS
jgi:hypothetical protein